MAKDPVCGMELEEQDAEFQSQYAGREYVFCSETCKDKFENNPEQYAASAA
jgi:YHS domain-containing protein